MRETSSLTSDIWHLTSSFWRNYADTLARPALRRANLVEKARFYFDCNHHARTGHWGEHGHFQSGQHGDVATAASVGAGADRRSHSVGKGRQHRGFLLSALQRFP